MTDLTKLVERLEQATGPDRVLDGLIFKVCAGAVVQPQDAWNFRPTWQDFDGVWHLQDRNDKCAYEPPPHFTGSIDAALTLVPEGWMSDPWIKRHNGHHWSVTLHIPSYQFDERHEHLPIAICMAAISAREHKGSPGDSVSRALEAALYATAKATGQGRPSEDKP